MFIIITVVRLLVLMWNVIAKTPKASYSSYYTILILFFDLAFTVRNCTMICSIHLRRLLLPRLVNPPTLSKFKSFFLFDRVYSLVCDFVLVVSCLLFY